MYTLPRFASSGFGLGFAVNVGRLSETAIVPATALPFLSRTLAVEGLPVAALRFLSNCRTTVLSEPDQPVSTLELMSAGAVAACAGMRLAARATIPPARMARVPRPRRAERVAIGISLLSWVGGLVPRLT